MNLSFLATIAFACLALLGALLANLIVLVFTGSQWHVHGVLAAILAAGASYWAQNQYTAGAIAWTDAQTSIHQVNRDALLIAAEKAQGWGSIFRALAFVLLIASLACFWLGMAPWVRP